MTTYRTGNHWGVTIVREGGEGALFGADAGPKNEHNGGCLWPATRCRGHRPGDQLVAVVVNGDQALAERICALLNADGDAAVAIQNFKLVTDAANDLAARRQPRGDA